MSTGRSPVSEDIDYIIEALHYVRMVRRIWASSPEAAKRIKDTTDALRLAGKNANRKALVVFADAIDEAWKSGPIRSANAPES
jgi:hypothetical protein